jgi:dynein heavy chain
VECSANELLRNSFPTMYGELEKCQKSLDGYLEQKQNAFPRFYFVSSAKLLIILSQGSDPLAMNDYYENVFDAIQSVEHDKKDRTIIYKINGSGGVGHEIIPFHEPVKAVGNIEDWLMALLKNMMYTMKENSRACAQGVADMGSDITQLRPLVDRNIAQFALLAVQIAWTLETQSALEVCRIKKTAMKDNKVRQIQVRTDEKNFTKA